MWHLRSKIGSVSVRLWVMAVQNALQSSVSIRGFLTITYRLSQFSKIGGEMVPHVEVEEKLHELAGTTA